MYPKQTLLEYLTSCFNSAKKFGHESRTAILKETPIDGKYVDSDGVSLGLQAWRTFTAGISADFALTESWNPVCLHFKAAFKAMDLEDTSEPLHFLLQHGNIPHKKAGVTLLTLNQIGFNAGQYAAQLEADPSSYSTEIQQFYLDNKLGDVATYVKL
jgi:hypothetical protein